MLFRRLAFSAVILAGTSAAARSEVPGVEDVLKALEPGIGYSRAKQWATENKLVFESFTKDQLVLRDEGVRSAASVRIFIRFCGGDDYAGRASSVTYQQSFVSGYDALVAQRTAALFLAGPATEFKLPGQFVLRRDRQEGASAGLTFAQDGESKIGETQTTKGAFELGVFASSSQLFILQVVRRKDAICS